MRVDLQLAERIAREAISEPFRQIKVMTTRDFTTWLGERGIRLRWQAIHYLWMIGVLHPIALLGNDSCGESIDNERFAPVNVGLRRRTFVDLGVDVPEDALSKNSYEFDLDHSLGDSVLWHPFQLWEIAHLYRVMEPRISAEAVLVDPAGALESAGWSLAHARTALIGLANSEKHHEFLRIVGLLLAVEPLVHTSIDPVVKLGAAGGQSIQNYVLWRERSAEADMLTAFDLTVEQVESWHRDIAVAAAMVDPLENFRILLQHSSRDRIQRLKRDALLAYTLYDAALVLRRYIEHKFDRKLPEEDEVASGAVVRDWKRRLYGSDRTSDFNRGVFRRIARSFDLDPQARLTWFLEGDTEEAFVQRFAIHVGIDLQGMGIDTVNLGGVGRLGSRHLRSLLLRLQQEEVFTFLTIDRELQRKHTSELRRLRQDGLLTAGFKIWERDFESDNFTIEELAQITSEIAFEQGANIRVTAAEIREIMDSRNKPVGVAIQIVASRNRVHVGKGAAWGAKLADWASTHEVPNEVMDDDRGRPIVSLFYGNLQAQHSNFRVTAEEFEVDSEGTLVRRSQDVSAI